MVRKYFLNNVSEAAVTTRSGNPFHKDTTRLQKLFLASSSLKACFVSLRVSMGGDSPY